MIRPSLRKVPYLLAILVLTTSVLCAQTNYSKFVFTNVNYNIICIDAAGSASMFALTLSTSADGSIFTTDGENLRYDIRTDSATPGPEEGTPVTAQGQFGEVIYDQSYTNVYRKLIRNPKTRKNVSVSLTNVETFSTATFSVSITDGEGGEPAILKGYVTRSFFTYGKASFNSKGVLVRGKTTAGPYYSESGGLAYDGKIGFLK
jgi:hypothetical protein